MHAIPPVVLIALACGGCAMGASYLDEPVGAPVAAHDPATLAIPVPTAAPQGSVLVTSLGITEVTPADGAPITTMHVRLSVANRTDEVPWTVAIRAARLETPGGRALAPLLVNSDLATLPAATIARGEQRVIDLYFALPAAIASEAELGPVDLAWEVTTRAGRHAARTAVGATAGVAVPRPTAALAAGWGGYWWCDPAYPWPTFYRRPGTQVHRPPTSVLVTRASTR